MSSSYSPYGGVPSQLCQRCGGALPPGESYCGNCGYFNPPAQLSPFAESYGSPSSNAQWGAGVAQAAPAQSQLGAVQWGQPAQSEAFAQPAFPQQPGGSSYGAPAQPVDSGSYYGNPAQNMNAGGYFNTPPPVQPSYGAPAMPGSFQPAAMSAPPQAQPQPDRTKTALLASIAIFLVVLIGGGIGGYIYINSHEGAGTPVSNVTSSPMPKGPALFADSFSNNNAGWNLQGEPGKFSVTLRGGTLTLEDDDNHMLSELIPGNKTFSDFKLFVDATLSKGDDINGYGIYIRGASSQNTELATYYRFELYGDRTYAIFKGTVDASGNSSSQLLVNYSSDPAIQPQGSVNHIEIVASGPTLTLIVNGTTLKTISDSSYTSGSIALFVSNVQNAKPGAQAQFSHFAIYPANS